MAAALLSPVAGALSKQAEEFKAGPWDYIANLLTEIGAFLLLIGIALGFVGYYLKAYSVKAKSDAAQGIATVTGVFANISFNAPQSPYLKINGPNVANDISNLGNDAWRFVDNTAQQAWGDLKGIGTAIEDIPKALIQMISQGPSIAINGFLGLVSEAFSDIFILVFPYAIIFGGAMLAVGVSMQVGRYVWDAYLKPEFSEAIDARLGAPLKSWVHRLLGNPDPAPPTLTVEGAPAGVAPGLSPGAAPSPVAPLPSAPAAPPSNTPAEISHETPGVLTSSPAPETLPAVPTTDQENALGASYTEARDRMKAAKRKRDMAQPEEDYVGWAFGQIRATA